jgi:hypothetical protein
MKQPRQIFGALEISPKDEGKGAIMAMKKTSAKRTGEKISDTKKELIQSVRQGDFDKETTESLIKEIEEICAFEDSLEEH